MGGTSIDKNPVCRLGVILPTIGVYDLDVLQAGEVIASAGSTSSASISIAVTRPVEPTISARIAV